MANKKVLLEEENGDKIYLHSLTDIIFDNDGKKLTDTISEINDEIAILSQNKAEQSTVNSALAEKANISTTDSLAEQIDVLSDEINILEGKTVNTYGRNKIFEICNLTSDRSHVEILFAKPDYHSSTGIGFLSIGDTGTKIDYHYFGGNGLYKGKIYVTKESGTLRVYYESNAYSDRNTYNLLAIYGGEFYSEAKEVSAISGEILFNSETDGKTLATTEKTEILQEQIDVLEGEVRWKPDNWKNEDDLPTSYTQYSSSIFYSTTSFNGVSQVIVKTDCRNQFRIVQWRYGNGITTCYRIGMGDYWTEWQQIATTEKTEILERELSDLEARIVALGG